MPTYTPPPLNRRIRIRNPDFEPAGETDRQGAATTSPRWGIPVWAGRRDRGPFTELSEGAEIRAGNAVFTIRKRGHVAPDSEVMDRDGVLYVVIGSPVERGGQMGGLRSLYLELHCQRRTALAV